jgi:hypothetical protein
MRVEHTENESLAHSPRRSAGDFFGRGKGRFSMSKRATLIATGVSLLLLSACDVQMPQSGGPETKARAEGGQVPPLPQSPPPIAAIDASAPVTAAAKPDPTRLRAGESFALIVDVQIAKGWHIYAIDRPTGPALPTSISIGLPKGLAWDGNWTFPDPSLDESSLGNPSFLHEGAVTFRRRVRVARDVSPGPLSLRGALHYQACDRYSCRAPAQLTLQTEIHVVP